MHFRVLILSFACLSCLLPAQSQPLTEGLARAAADVAVAKGAALLAAKTALVKGAASLALKGATIGSHIVLGAISSGLEATAEAIKPSSESSSSTGHTVAGVLDKFSKVIELKKQLGSQVLEHLNPPVERIPVSVMYEPIVVRDVMEPQPMLVRGEPQPILVREEPHPFVLPPQLPVFDVACADEIQFEAPRVLPPHLYHLGSRFSSRLLRRDPYRRPFVRTFRHH